MRKILYGMAAALTLAGAGARADCKYEISDPPVRKALVQLVYDTGVDLNRAGCKAKTPEPDTPLGVVGRPYCFAQMKCGDPAVKFTDADRVVALCPARGFRVSKHIDWRCPSDPQECFDRSVLRHTDMNTATALKK